ncbi:MAG: hypothetical protein JSU79_09655 [Dehalococcoidales bacterium]|nr:MAG: hypothetical protein JSU79_09655 [Dehalococcoidales bacterium]
MTAEDIEKRLENMILPDIQSADHREELKASLLEHYYSLQAEGERNGLLSSLRLRVVQNRQLNKAGVLMVSISFIVIVIIFLALQLSGIFLTSSSVIAKACTAI